MDDQAHGGDEELRSEVEDALYDTVGIGGLDDVAWRTLRGNEGFEELLKEKAYEKCAYFAAGVVWAARRRACGLRKQRRRFVKPSARRRYSALLEHVSSQCVLQFAERFGFTEARQDGRERVRYFDLQMHLHDVFNPDVDFDSIRQAWNAQHPEDSFDDTETFKRICRRALRHIGDPLVRLALPARGERRPTARIEEARARKRGVVATVNLCKFAAEYHGVRFRWGVAAKIYADSPFGKSVEPQTLRSWYYAGLKDEKLHGKTESLKAFSEGMRRRSATWEEYSEQARKFLEDVRRAQANMRARKGAGVADGQHPPCEAHE